MPSLEEVKGLARKLSELRLSEARRKQEQESEKRGRVNSLCKFLTDALSGPEWGVYAASVYTKDDKAVFVSVGGLCTNAFYVENAGWSSTSTLYCETKEECLQHALNVIEAELEKEKAKYINPPF